MKHRKEVSENIDEYLEEMYRCEKEKKKISTKELAEKLKISMPSVSEMLVKLRDKKLIEYQSRGRITLTTKGRKVGSTVYKKFETLKKFLIKLGFEETEAEKEACKLEHAVSDRLEKKLREYTES